LEGDDPYECSRETEHQAEEPEDIHADADGVNPGPNFGDPSFARRLGCDLPQELNAFLIRILEEVLFRFDEESGHDRRE
jgi:hypothetical protein